MAENLSSILGNVERFPGAYPSTSVTDELNEILGALRQAFPDAAHISFDFDGHLHVHIDVRKREQVTLVQAALPSMAVAHFHRLRMGGTPNHPFLHRVSAIVEA
jgi:hypothetical protein